MERLNPHWFEGVTPQAINRSVDRDALLDLIPKLWCERDGTEDHQGATGAYDGEVEELMDLSIEDLRSVALGAFAACDFRVQMVVNRMLSNMMIRFLNGYDADLVDACADREQEAIADLDRLLESLT